MNDTELAAMSKRAEKWVECYGLAEAQRRAYNLKDETERRKALEALRQYELSHF